MKNKHRGFTLISLLLLRKRSCKGFTLIELLVVISIIAILSVIGIVVFTNVQNNARVSATKATLNAIYKQIETKRILEGKILEEITLSYCTHCSCYSGPCSTGGEPGCAITHESLLYPGCQARLQATFITGLGMASIPVDGWGDPIVMDENELERAGSGACLYHDNIWSIHGPGFSVPFLRCPN